MTDRHGGYIVTLAVPTREDDAEAIIAAIMMIKGVVSVEPVVDDYLSVMARTQLRWDVKRKLFEALDQVLGS